MRRRAAGRLRCAVDTGIAELVTDPDRPGGRTLYVDGAPQSHVDIDDPAHIVFEYIRRLAHVVDLAPPGPLRVLHLGGGALTLPRYVAATRPGSGQQVVEIDRALADLVRRELPLERTARVRLRIGDARDVLAREPPLAFDVVVVDAFTAGRMPASLASTEFVALVARALHPAGTLALNTADGGGLTFARALVATVRSVFDKVAVLVDPTVLAGKRFGNIVLAASQVLLPVDGYVRRTASDPFPGRVLHGPALDRFTGGAKPMTDRSATGSPSPPGALFAG
ncbi:MAG TPA: fused MFS/spermidine synthase [Pseudonocardiaceae bacterium]|jgi:spermidine synthase|nr:fused MFS/spermidine synthase [Pseudonocardiaceae bacterium]